MRMMNKNTAILKPRNQLPVKYAVMLKRPVDVQKSPDETRSEPVKQRRKQGRKQGRKRGVSGGDGPK